MNDEIDKLKAELDRVKAERDDACRSTNHNARIAVAQEQRATAAEAEVKRLSRRDRLMRAARDGFRRRLAAAEARERALIAERDTLSGAYDAVSRDLEAERIVAKRYWVALTEIAKPGYGLDLTDSDKEQAEHSARDAERCRSKARAALTPPAAEGTTLDVGRIRDACAACNGLGSSHHPECPARPAATGTTRACVFCGEPIAEGQSRVHVLDRGDAHRKCRDAAAEERETARKCPSATCPACSGETCDACSGHPRADCEHDVIERHTPPAQPSAESECTGEYDRENDTIIHGDWVYCPKHDGPVPPPAIGVAMAQAGMVAEGAAIAAASPTPAKEPETCARCGVVNPPTMNECERCGASICFGCSEAVHVEPDDLGAVCKPGCAPASPPPAEQPEGAILGSPYSVAAIRADRSEADSLRAQLESLEKRLGLNSSDSIPEWAERRVREFLALVKIHPDVPKK